MACVICNGNKFVKLPVYRELTPYSSANVVPMMTEESHRTYPCPECNEQTAAEEKVSILYASETVREFKRMPPDAVDHIHRSMSMALADRIRRDGLIEFHSEQRGEETLFVAKMAVVNPKAATRIERRAFDMMRKFLGNVAERAAANISMWGSHYTGNEGMISKGQAIDYMRASFDAALNEHEVGK